MTARLQGETGADIWLALDTSSSSLAVALLEGDNVLGSIQSQAERNHSLYLVPTIQELLQECDLQLKDVKGFAVGVGPGSYTGVRIAVTVAKTMAWTMQVPIVGVSSLEALAYGAVSGVSGTTAGETWRIVPLLDGRRGQAFTACFDAVWQGQDTGGWRWTRRVEDRIQLVSDWLVELEQMDSADKIVFVGECQGFAEQLQTWVSGRKGSYQDTLLDASDAGKLGQKRYVEQGADDPHVLVPNYAQLAEAEVKLKAREAQAALEAKEEAHGTR